MVSSRSLSPSSGGTAPFDLLLPGSWAEATMDWEDAGFPEHMNDGIFDVLEDQFVNSEHKASRGVRTGPPSWDEAAASGPASSECNVPERSSSQDEVLHLSAPWFAPATLERVLLAIRPDPFLEQSLPKGAPLKQKTLWFLWKHRLFTSIDLLCNWSIRELPEQVRPFYTEVSRLYQAREKARNRMLGGTKHLLPPQASVSELLMASEPASSVFAPPVLPVNRTISSEGLRFRQEVSVAPARPAGGDATTTRIKNLAGILISIVSTFPDHGTKAAKLQNPHPTILSEKWDKPWGYPCDSVLAVMPLFPYSMERPKSSFFCSDSRADSKATNRHTLLAQQPIRGPVQRPRTGIHVWRSSRFVDH